MSEDFQTAVRLEAHERGQDWHERRSDDETTIAEHWADVARDERWTER